jgi:glycolate oxidase iron-sulfur subunit
MQTRLADFIRDTPEGREAEAILRKCVHCGFCTATCPTYQVLGDDLDSPRGRIYLMKRALEGGEVTEKTRLHLDRCLTCRACETTCPSGVRYGRLVDIGRAVVEARTRRSPLDRARRALLAFGIPRSALFGAALRLGQLVGKAPRTRVAGRWPAARHARRMLVLRGCVQPALAPSINAATARVLDRVGISLLEAPGAGCCGGVRFHLNRQDEGRDDMRALIDAWWPLVAGTEVEAIVMTASGCGVTVKEYGHLLEADREYRGRAERVSEMTRDLAEILDPQALPAGAYRGRVAFHAPCTLQHGQQIHGKVEALLARVGYELVPVRDAHLCCGSAGTYSLLQPEIANELRTRKLAALQEGAPQAIATANIGCLAHLQEPTSTPVRHWIELVDEALA